MSSSLSSFDRQILLCHVLKKSKEFLFAHPEHPITKKEKNLLRKLTARRKKHEPIAYIFGKKEFFGRDFFVNKNVLIPRPLTESLVELVIIESQRHGIDTIIDVGTGSGCIITTLAKELPQKNIRFIATDISESALFIAKKNTKQLGVSKKIQFYKGDLFSSVVGARDLAPLQNETIVIIANLPYISPKKYKTLSSDIRLYEPKSALVAKDGGLYYYKKLLREIRRCRDATCRVPTILCFEIDPDQKTALKKYIKKIFPKRKIQFFLRSHIVKISL